MAETPGERKMRLMVELLTKSLMSLNIASHGKKKDALSASSHVLYHPFEVQGRGGKEAVILRCL